MSNSVKCFKVICKRFGGLAPVIASLIFIAGCRSAAPVTPHSDIGTVQARWNTSVEHYQRLRLRGQIQIHWQDEDGSHSEQGDLDALLDGETRSSMRITKFGDVMLWFTITPNRAWIFDMLSEPTRLTVRTPEELQTQLTIRPEVLRLLLGIDPWPADAKVQLSGGDVVLTATTLGGQLTATLEPSTLRPKVITLAFPEEGPFVGRHRWTTGEVRVGGAQGGRRIATVVDIVTPEALLKLRTSTIVALTAAEMKPLAAVWFDLDRVRSHLKPEVLE